MVCQFAADHFLSVTAIMQSAGKAKKVAIPRNV
jgi:hypothetical protein